VNSAVPGRNELAGSAAEWKWRGKKSASRTVAVVEEKRITGL